VEEIGLEQIRKTYDTIASSSFGICYVHPIWGTATQLTQATQDGLGLPFLNAVFTAISAVCVTGLVV